VTTPSVMEVGGANCGIFVEAVNTIESDGGNG